MKIFSSILLIAVFLGACTKSQKAAEAPTKQNLLNYKSAISYSYDKLQDPTQAAFVDGSPVSWDQLYAQDVALQELEDRYRRQAYDFTIAWAESIGQPDGQKIKFFGGKTSTDMPTLPEEQFEFAEVNREGTLAEMGDKTVTWQQFNEASLNHAKTYKKIFQQRMHRLNGIVVRRFILKASQEQKMPMEEYIQANILKGGFEPSIEDVKQFMAEKGISESSLDENMEKRLKAILVQNDRDEKIEKYVAKTFVKEPVKVAFKGPMLSVKLTEVDASLPHWGKSGDSKLLFFGHWNCEGCKEALQSFLDFKGQFESNIQGYFIYSFPDRDREARMGAEAALCVESIDQNAFWSFLENVVEIEEQNVEEKLNQAAKAAGVDFAEFRSCFLKRQHQQKVDTHLAIGKNLGFNRYPIMILKGQVFEAPIDMNMLSTQINSMTTAKTKSKLSLWGRIKAFFGF